MRLYLLMKIGKYKNNIRNRCLILYKKNDMSFDLKRQSVLTKMTCHFI